MKRGGGCVHQKLVIYSFLVGCWEYHELGLRYNTLNSFFCVLQVARDLGPWGENEVGLCYGKNSAAVS